MLKVFISYDPSDAEFADLLGTKLLLKNFDVHMERPNMDAGGDSRVRVELAIRNSQVLVVIFSRRATQSLQITLEWALGLGAGIPVVPVQLEPCELHPRLVSTTQLDFTGRQRPWDSLYDALLRAGPRRPVTTSSGFSPAVRKAVAALDSLDEDERIEAVKALARIDDSAANTALQKALHHTSRSVRIAAARSITALGRLGGNAEVVRSLLEGVLYGDTEARVELSIARTVPQVGSAAIPVLREYLRDESGLRDLAVQGLSLVADASLTSTLIEIFRESADRCVLAGLEISADPAAIPFLLECLGHNDHQLRAKAVAALGVHRDATVVGRLVHVLTEEPKSEVRAAAVSALGRMGNMTALPALIERLNDQSEKDPVRGAAIDAVRELKATQAVPHLRRLLEPAPQPTISHSFNWRAAAVPVLLQFRDSASAPLLVCWIKAYTQFPEDRRIEMVRTLETWGELALPVLHELLNDEGWPRSFSRQRECGAVAARLLQRIGSPADRQAAIAWMRRFDV